MPTFLFIAGHGENKNGSFDPGATGIISKGEHKYFEQDFFPAIKKFLPANSDVVLYSTHNVYDYKDLVTLSNKYGKDTVVIEMHYDAGSSSASGGHVIVHADYAPDKYDLAIRDVIKKHIGVRYTHKGQEGISGRDNLGNCNRAKTGGINYRLVELGFGTNKKDADTMVKNVDAIAKDFVQALIGKSNNKPIAVTKPVATPVASKPATKSIETLVTETKAGKHGNGEARKKSLGSNYDAVMKIINGGSKPAAKPVVKAPVNNTSIEKEIQATVGVSQDGKLGINSKRGIVKLVQRWIGVKDDGIWGNTSASRSKTMRKGDNGLNVYALQAMLYAKGFKSVGKPDNKYGSKTVQAVKDFQKANRLSVDGIAGVATQNKLFKI